MRNQRRFGYFALLVVATLVLAACTGGGQIDTGKGLCREIGDNVAAEPSTPESTGTSDLVIGLVTDVGTLDDANFNQYSWEGALQGAAIIGAPEPGNIVTTDSSQYEDNINSFVDDGADIIITVGFALGAATLAAAQENPDIHFVGVDQFQANDPTGNYESLIFNEAQAGYLAGILAGSISESGEVAALGGSGTIPPVVNYMRGFENGVHSVNEDANVHLKYVSNDLAVAFNDPTTGKSFADEFLSVNEDVDVLFQVAGKTGNGMLDSVVEHGIYGFGVDVDQWISYPSAQVCIVTSAEKHLTLAVSESITTFASGDARDSNVFYGADNDGIGLAPYYQFGDLVSDDTQAAIDDAFDGMASGDLDPCEPSGLCYAGEEDLGTE
ncbi:MAG TPA: BMP family ABC transporter substrate-binding protein [Candidatus Limnocylindria bacterium]|jgi:basic membrane protein A